MDRSIDSDFLPTQIASKRTGRWVEYALILLIIAMLAAAALSLLNGDLSGVDGGVDSGFN